MKDIYNLIVEEEKINPLFRILNKHKPIEPAKLMIETIVAEMVDQDGNFVQQFQTTGFIQRLWEIFLFKFLIENNFIIDYTYNRPDFNVKKDGSNFFIEASLSSEKDDEKFTKEYILEAQRKKDLNVQAELISYYVIRMGSVLYSKLMKKYWELDWVKDKPLVFAITPAHSYLANFLPDAKIIEYLYGFSYEGEVTTNGLVSKKKHVETHKYGDKEIPSNFFSLENTENISAVIFTNNNDLHKFNRMGYQAGLSNLFIVMERAGMAFDSKPSIHPVEFKQSIHPGEIKEDWNEGVSVFHNPNAKYPINKDLFQNVRQVWIDENGELGGTMPAFFPFNSITMPVCLKI